MILGIISGIITGFISESIFLSLLILYIVTFAIKLLIWVGAQSNLLDYVIPPAMRNGKVIFAAMIWPIIIIINRGDPIIRSIKQNKIN